MLCTAKSYDDLLQFPPHPWTQYLVLITIIVNLKLPRVMGFGQFDPLALASDSATHSEHGLHIEEIVLLLLQKYAAR